jgi:type IV pilus assembly protein PilB
MPLGRTQTQIIDKLEEMGKLTSEQKSVLLARPDEPTGDQLDQILQADHHITMFQLLLAKCRALGLAPYNVARYRVHANTFEKIDLEFCQKNMILPVGQVGDFLLVAFANPFDTTVATKIQDKTGQRVVRLLGREADIREKLKKDQVHDEVQFSDVVDQLGAQFEEAEAEIKDEDLENEESAPIIQLANRIIEDAYFAGTPTFTLSPGRRKSWSATASTA